MAVSATPNVTAPAGPGPAANGPPANEGCGYRAREQERLNDVALIISGERWRRGPAENA
jgi:hypothetical protein